MRIKRIEIIGFKSFADRSVINIDTSVTAVVGPNGCGKSNIVDAIRWCMGEQSAKHLRGGKMEDVIFAGSESRGGAQMAEVSLTFDDVGYSQANVELAMNSDEADAERALASLETVGGENVADVADDGEQGGVALDVADALIAQAFDQAEQPQTLANTVSDAPLIAPEGVDGTINGATTDVANFLADDGGKLDFSSFTEVTITRRLYRDGTSQYFINKTSCRLRDVTDFFLGTGVGTKAYSIIEQGRIGQIVSSRPVDRRAIIEEAAGITKFKTKKKAAEKKLDQTRQNLLRVSDIVTELDKRMGTLRRQAQKAERYRKYKTELRDVDLWKASHRFLDLRAEESVVGGRMVEASVELEAVRTEWSVQDAQMVIERADLAVEERRLAALQEVVYELDNRIRLGESKIGFESREADELEARLSQGGDEVASLETQRETARVELETRQTELGELAEVVAREDEDVALRAARTAEARAMLDRAQRDLDQARAQLAATRTEIATTEAQQQALIRRREEGERRLARVVDETATVAERSKDVERELRRAEVALSELRQTRLDLGNQTEHFAARAEILADEISRGETEVETLRTEAHRRRSRMQSLVEIQERYEGFARGTRAVMQQAEQLASGSGAIRGLVADVVRAPETLEIAVEAALGDRLGGVLVDNSAVGLAAIDYLKSSSSGRSAFVPMLAESASQHAWGGGSIEVEDRSALVAAMPAVGGEGVLGRMSDLVEFADGYQSLGIHLLNGCIVVDRLDRAVALHDNGVHDTLVTLDGDVVDSRGVVFGGSREAQGNGVLAQKREIRDLEEIVEGLDRDLGLAMTRLLEAKTEHKQLVKAVEGLKSQAHQGDLAIMGHDKDVSRLRGEHERLRERLLSLSTEQLELEERMASIVNDDQGMTDRRLDAETKIGELEGVQLGLIEGVTSGRDLLEELSSELTQARVRSAQLGEKRASIEAQALRLAKTDQELEQRVRRLTAEMAEATTRVEALRASAGALSEELVAHRERREVEGAALDEGRTSYEQRVITINAADLTVRELRGRSDRLVAEVGQLELRLGNIEMNRKVLLDGIDERYQLELHKVVVDFHMRPVAGDVEDKRLAELRDLIDRMGTDINLTAIDEYAEVSTRFEFLSAQRADLESAVDQLQRAIDKINKTSRRLFKETFTSVNATFKQVFPRLFRGGQAHLSLTGGDDVDLLEAGVEIMAQPPGKKNSTVEQLSGGEKALTAVALIFSIFLIKPSPFCILDEVDAPLDEANVDRYNEIVREMTDRSQFIVITHNKRTMESADNLYGVTMQEPGVSKLVGVNLSKVGSKAAAA